jgi:hypothetical protein
MPVAGLQLCNKQQWSNWEAVFSTWSMPIATWCKIELLGDMFSVGSMLRLYKEDQLSFLESPETAVRRLGGWCEVAASLGDSPSQESVS